MATEKEKSTDVVKVKPEPIPQDMFSIDTKAFQKRREEAFKRLIDGKTPLELQKERPGRGGTTQRYVDIGYMTEQINLLTRFSWQHELLEEKERVNSKGEVIEIGALVKVTIGNVSHTSWGQKDVARAKADNSIISLFDDKKAAISDGIKKCLSYFGIAADVYAGKELEFYLTDLEGSGKDSGTGMKVDQAKKMFNKYVESKNLVYSKVFKILSESMDKEIKSLSQITDFADAYKRLKKAIEK